MNTRTTLKILGICALCTAVLLSLCIWFLLGGSDFTKYPGEKSSIWICDDPYIHIRYSPLGMIAHLEWDGEDIPIFIGMKSSAYDVYRIEPGDQVLHYENILFRGYWHYKGKNMVLKIYEDNIFNGAYTELVFSPQ